MKRNNSITIEKIVKELLSTYQYHKEDYSTSLKFAKMLIAKEDECEFERAICDEFQKKGLI